MPGSGCAVTGTSMVAVAVAWPSEAVTVKESAPSGKEVAIEYKVLGGVSAGQLVDAKGVEQISKLPTKTELIAKIAALIQEAGAQGLARKLKNAKGMPQGIAKRMKKAAGQKLVVAVKMGPGSEEKNMS